MDEKKTERVSYSELARRVGDCILNNELQSELGNEYEFELVNGADSYCYKHEDGKGCEDEEQECEHEGIDVYQTYIITEDGADYLKRKTDQIVYHCERLGIYLWGITHFGTSWTHVYTNVEE